MLLERSVVTTTLVYTVLTTNLYDSFATTTLGQCCNQERTETCQRPGQAKTWLPFNLLFFKYLSIFQHFDKIRFIPVAF
jgi:hypothetical protein